MSKFNSSQVQEVNPESFTTEDFVAALEDIAEADPDLIPYIVTCYPPELMVHMSPEICQRLDQLKKSSYLQESTGS